MRCPRAPWRHVAMLARPSSGCPGCARADLNFNQMKASIREWGILVATFLVFLYAAGSLLLAGAFICALANGHSLSVLWLVALIVIGATAFTLGTYSARDEPLN